MSHTVQLQAEISQNMLTTAALGALVRLVLLVLLGLLGYTSYRGPTPLHSSLLCTTFRSALWDILSALDRALRSALNILTPLRDSVLPS